MRFVVSGTDTDIGKTVFAAGLAQMLGARYWKPVQAGIPGDSETVAQLAGVYIVPEAYRLKLPASPHQAAAEEGIVIDPDSLVPPNGPLVIEGAGGLMVPLTDEAYVVDLATELHLPLILVARSSIGTINHTLLSLEAIRRRGLPLAGVVINGPETPHNRAAIERYGQVEVIAEIPWLETVNLSTLLAIQPELDLAKLARAEP
jgi:dethiobiotin synthase